LLAFCRDEGIGDIVINSLLINLLDEQNQLMAHINDLVQSRSKYVITASRFALPWPHDLLSQPSPKEISIESRL